MPELTPPAARRDARRHGARGPGGLRGFHLLISLVPAAVLILAGAGTVGFLLAKPQPASVTRTVLIAAAAVAVVVLAAATWGGTAATRRVRGRLAALRSASVRSQADLLLLAERVQHGERPSLRAPDPVAGGAGDPFTLLARDLQQERHAAREALLQVAVHGSGGRTDHRAEVSASLAVRMQALVDREAQLLGELKAQIWDQAVLQGLLAVDHLAARARRQLESLAVIAGAGPLRQWTQSVPVDDALQAAAAEVEYSARVTVVPPVHGVLRPEAVADVIHLVAELVDNATRFSAPHARTLVRADSVAAGLAIEVEDRGFGMSAAERHRINTLLSHPKRAEASQLLSGGHTGLFVISELTRRHGMEVQLQGNIYGGTQAVVVLPGNLLEGGTSGQLAGVQPQAVPATAAEPPAAAVPPAAAAAAPPAPAAAAGPEAPAAPAAAGPEAAAAPAGGPASDDTPVMFRRVAPPPAATDWTQPPPEPVWPPPPADPADSLWPVPPSPPALPEPAGAPVQHAEVNGHPLLPAANGHPHPAPPPREEQAGRGEEQTIDRIADLMAAFRNPAGPDETDPGEKPGQPG